MIIKMLIALLSQPLFLDTSLAFIYFSNILAECDMCSPLLLPHHLDQDPFEDTQRIFRTSRRTFPPVSYLWSSGVSVARINANWNTYLFTLMTFGLVCNKFNSGTLWHCYCYSLLSSCVCNFDPGAYMIYCSILLLQNWAWHLAIMALSKGIHYHHLAVPLTFFCWEPIEHSVKSLPSTFRAFAVCLRHSANRRNPVVDYVGVSYPNSSSAVLCV